ncbi:MAG: hypothetical protein LBH73_01565, partial [Spirochaetaceae bacterium]|nr:hypothetical protein [Spirochaetaceae bacterium]
MRKENIVILTLFILSLYCYNFILRITLYDFVAMIAFISPELIYEFFFDTKYFSTFPKGMPLFIWSIYFMIIVIFYIYIIIKCFVNDRAKIFINAKI